MIKQEELEDLILEIEQVTSVANPYLVGCALVQIIADNMLRLSKDIPNDTREKIVCGGIDCLAEDAKAVAREVTGTHHAAPSMVQ